MTTPRTVLVTGGCGYLGSILIRRLAQEPDIGTIRILDNLQRDSHRALFDLPTDGPRYHFLHGDLMDPGMQARALHGVDTVYHLAGIVRTPMAFENPTWMRQVNQWGTHRLAETAASQGVKRFVFASSTAVYGPGEDHDEDALLRPIGPYAASKAQAEGAIRTACEGRTACVITRLGMIYGDAPAVRLDGFVNRMMFQAATAGYVTIHGTGQQRRPVIHVQDAAEALRLLGRVEAAREHTFNAVSANPSILDVAASIREHLPRLKLRHADQDVPTHLTFTADASKLRSFGWQTRVDHHEAVGEFVRRIG